MHIEQLQGGYYRRRWSDGLVELVTPDGRIECERERDPALAAKTQGEVCEPPGGWRGAARRGVMPNVRAVASR